MKYLFSILFIFMLSSCGDTEQQHKTPQASPEQIAAYERQTKFFEGQKIHDEIIASDEKRLAALKKEKDGLFPAMVKNSRLSFTVKRRFSTIEVKGVFGMEKKGVYEALDSNKRRMIVIYCDPAFIEKHGLGVEIEYRAGFVGELEYDNTQSNEFRSVKTKEFRPTYNIINVDDYDKREKELPHLIKTLENKINAEGWKKHKKIDAFQKETREKKAAEKALKK